MADTQETAVDAANIHENNDDMEVVTMVDVLKEEQDLEDDANAVLGGSDEKNCTYTKGYLKRQALYACVTCIPESKTDPAKRAGVCLACSYQCHENHDLIELYTKRNFRCDCGTAKFPGRQCNLDAEKAAVNELNTYNHNFSGLYCTCERPYPDPDDKVADDMIQCIVCEDWYHCRHLGVPVPPTDAYSEMTCTSCITKHEFLLRYSGLAVSRVAKADSDVDLSVETPVQQHGEAVPVSQNGSGTAKTGCTMPRASVDTVSAKFWPENWRSFLCACKPCLAMYAAEQVSYLIDTQDTVHAYEEKGKAKALENSAGSQYERGMKALSSLDRVKQVEAITEYNTMKEQLKEYLQKFADNKKIVREEDIREFFSNMAARKKQKIDVPHFCR